MSYPNGLVPLALVRRGRIDESIHLGRAVVVDAKGRVVARAGDIDGAVTTRSCVKVMQALEWLGLTEGRAFDGDLRAVPLMCASHAVHPRYVDTAAAMLRHIVLSESDLRCGAHPVTSAAAIEGLAGAAPTQ